MKTKSIAALLGLLIMVLSVFTACAEPNKPQPNDPVNTNAPEESNEYQESITYIPNYAFKTMDVQDTTAATDIGIYKMVYDRLIDFDTAKNQMVPSVAENWEWTSPTEVVLNLCKGIKFHNGTELTAEDVKFSLERALTKSIKNRISQLDHVEVLDTYKVKLVLNKPNLDFLYMLIDGWLSILSKQAFETMSEEEAIKVGSGPFEYEEFVKGDHVILVRNENYWKGPAKTKRFIIRLIPEKAARLIALQNGDVDIIESPATTDLHYITDNSSLRLYSFTGYILRHFTLNTSIEPLNDPKVRTAIAYGINRDEYNTVVYNDTATIANNVMHPLNEFYKQINAIEYNPEKAKQLLADAGFKPGDITLELLVINSSEDTSFATLFQAQMKEIGINVNVNPEDVTAFVADRIKSSKFQVILDSWGSYTAGPDNALRPLYHPDGAMNEANINDEFINSRLDEAVSCNDSAKRAELYADIQQYVNDQAFDIPICFLTNFIAAKADVRGISAPYGLMCPLENLYCLIQK